jgi:hypothetical protein
MQKTNLTVRVFEGYPNLAASIPENFGSGLATRAAPGFETIADVNAK